MIDLTFTNTLGNQLINSWKVDRTSSISGHKILRYKLYLGEITQFASRSVAKCDGQLYYDQVKLSFSNKPFWFQPVASREDLNKRQTFVDTILTNCFNNACPIINGTRKSSVPWWTAELTKAKSITKALRNRAHRTRTDVDWSAYIDHNEEYRKLIRSAKRTGWKSFTANIQGAKPSTRIFKILNHNTNSTASLNSVIGKDGLFTTSPQDTLQVMVDTLILDDVTPEVIPPVPPEQERILNITTPERLERAKEHLKLGIG